MNRDKKEYILKRIEEIKRGFCPYESYGSNAAVSELINIIQDLVDDEEERRLRGIK